MYPDTTPAPPPPTKRKNRTVKVSDVLHHRIRLLAVKQRMPMQLFIEQMLTIGLRDKIYEKFDARPVM